MHARSVAAASVLQSKLAAADQIKSDSTFASASLVRVAALIERKLRSEKLPGSALVFFERNLPLVAVFCDLVLSNMIHTRTPYGKNHWPYKLLWDFFLVHGAKIIKEKSIQKHILCSDRTHGYHEVTALGAEVEGASGLWTFVLDGPLDREFFIRIAFFDNDRDGWRKPEVVRELLKPALRDSVIVNIDNDAVVLRCCVVDVGAGKTKLAFCLPTAAPGTGFNMKSHGMVFQLQPGGGGVPAKDVHIKDKDGHDFRLPSVFYPPQVNEGPVEHGFEDSVYVPATPLPLARGPRSSSDHSTLDYSSGDEQVAERDAALAAGHAGRRAGRDEAGPSFRQRVMSELETARAEKQLFQGESDRLRAEAATAAAAAAALAANLTAERDTARDEKAQLEHQLAQLRADAEAAAGERETAREAKAQLEQQLAQLRATAAAAAVAGRWRRRQLRTAVEAARAEAAGLVGERDTALVAKAQLEEQLAQLQADAEAGAGDRDTARVAKAQLEEQLAQLQADAEAAAGDRDTAREAKAQLEQQLAQLRAAAAAAGRWRRRQLRAKMEAARAEADQRIEEARAPAAAELEEARSEAAQLRARLEALERDLRSVREAALRLLSAKTTELKEQRAKTARLETELQTEMAKASEPAAQAAGREAASTKAAAPSLRFWRTLLAGLSCSIAVAAVAAFAVSRWGIPGRLGFFTRSGEDTELEAAHAAMAELRARVEDQASQAGVRGAELDAIIGTLRVDKQALQALVEEWKINATQCCGRVGELNTALGTLQEDKQALLNESAAVRADKQALEAQVEEWKLNATQCSGLVGKLRANKKALAENYLALHAKYEKAVRARKDARQVASADRVEEWRPLVQALYYEIKAWWYSRNQEEAIHEETEADGPKPNSLLLG
eukprot:tig00000178_g12813.t1